MAALGHVLNYRQFDRLRRGNDARQELEDGRHAFALPRAGKHHRRAELFFERGHIQIAAAAPQLIGHIQDDQRGGAERQDRCGQHQVPLQVGGIEQQQDGVGFGRIRALPLEHIVRHLLVFRSRREAVDAGQVDNGDLAAIGELRHAGVLLHGDAGEIGYLLAQSGEFIK